MALQRFTPIKHHYEKFFPFPTATIYKGGGHLYVSPDTRKMLNLDPKRKDRVILFYDDVENSIVVARARKNEKAKQGAKIYHLRDNISIGGFMKKYGLVDVYNGNCYKALSCEVEGRLAFKLILDDPLVKPPRWNEKGEIV